MLIPEKSPLHNPPTELSRRQVVILDGVRYAIEMADIAYERLARQLQGIAASFTDTKPSFWERATAMLDAWSIVDSAHRMRDLVANLPGLPNSKWKRLFQDRTDEVADLRDCAQHQLDRIDEIISGGGQIWGYLSWAELRDGNYTGKWLMMAAGADYVGDRFMFMGPNTLPFNVPNGRIRLNAFGKQVYVGRVLNAMIEAGVSLENDITAGLLKPVGEPPRGSRGADAFSMGFVEVVVSCQPSVSQR